MGLERFISAQQEAFPRAMQEMINGRKISHWMWYIFPQIDGLGHSPTTKHYSIKGLAEAEEYISHPLLGPRLIEITNLVLQHEGKTAHEIFGTPDDLKLRSCMTLFASLVNPNPVFEQVLIKYFDGIKDERTLEQLV